MPFQGLGASVGLTVPSPHRAALSLEVTQLPGLRVPEGTPSLLTEQLFLSAAPSLSPCPGSVFLHSS